MEKEDNVCSICLHGFSQPKILTCLHVYCLQCLSDYVQKSVEDGQFPCPLCRCQTKLSKGGVMDFEDVPIASETLADDVIEASSIGMSISNEVQTSTDMSTQDTITADEDVVEDKYDLDNVEDSASNNADVKICDVCESNEDVIFRCEDCKETMCTECNINHNKFKMFKNHIVVNISNEHLLLSNHGNPENVNSGQNTRDQSGYSFCQLHQSKPVEIFCTDCDMKGCISCLISSHNGHTILDLNIEENHSKLRDDLKSLNDEVKLEIKRLEDYGGELRSKILESDEKTEKARNKVDEQVNKICEIVKTHGEDIKAHLTAVNTRRREKLEEMMTKGNELVEKLKCDIKTSLVDLEESSIIRIIDTTQTNRQDWKQAHDMDLIIPNLQWLDFKPGSIIDSQLYELLGQVDSLKVNPFKFSFNTNFIVQKNVKDIQYFYYKGFEWCIAVTKQGDMCAIYVVQTTSVINKVDKIQLDDRLTILNKISHKSCQLKIKVLKTSEDWIYYYVPSAIKWDTLSDPRNGFVDEDGIFYVSMNC